MKLNMISARAAAAGVMSLGVLAGVGVVAGPASAASPTHLCIHFQNACIYAAGPNGAELAPASTPGMTNWYYPSQVGQTQTISQANVNKCLQLDWAKTDPETGAHLVIGAPCVNDDAEEWVNEYDSALKRTWFESKWAADNGYGAQCLWADPNNGDLSIMDCVPDAGDISIFEGWSTS